MGGGGFEPPKQFAADLQSVPFGHSGNHPIQRYIFCDLYSEARIYAGFVPKLIAGGRQARDEVAFKWLDCGLSKTQSQKVIL